jgi:hypothetical protein
MLYALLIYGDPAAAPADLDMEEQHRTWMTYTDGPFAETKEILGGFYLIDVENLDEALAWASRMPNIAYASVEVRPVLPMS